MLRFVQNDRVWVPFGMTWDGALWGFGHWWSATPAYPAHLLRRCPPLSLHEKGRSPLRAYLAKSGTELGVGGFVEAYDGVGVWGG